MDDLMVGKKSPKQMTWREHQQCWRINQMYATRILTMFAFTTCTGVMCLIAWAMQFANKSHSGWKSCISREVATWLSMPSMILGFHFEAELSGFFDETYAWHNQTGPLHT